MRRRSFALFSRLGLAWAGLAMVTLIAGVVAFRPRPVPDAGVVVELPEIADGFAGAPDPDGRPLTPRAPTLAGADDGLPVVLTDGPADSASGSRRILVPDAAPGDGATLADDAPPGELRITIPDSAPTGAAKVAASGGPSAPDPSLVRTTADGAVPHARGARTPFDVYRRAAPSAAGPRMAILVTGLGLDPALTEAARRILPVEIALGFAPYGRNVEGAMAGAAAAGHEVLLELPMESAGVPADALGPAGLLTGRTLAANARRLDWLLARSPAYPMVTNYLGQTFTRDAAQLQGVLETLDAAGLAYIDDTGLARAAARDLGLNYAAVDVLVAPDALDAGARLDAALAQAAAGRPVLVKVYASEASLAALAVALRMAEARGVTLVPVSAMVSPAP